MSDGELDELERTFQDACNRDFAIEAAKQITRRKQAKLSDGCETRHIDDRKLSGCKDVTDRARAIQSFLSEAVQFAIDGDELSLTSACWIFGKKDFDDRLNIQTDGWLIIRDCLLETVLEWYHREDALSYDFDDSSNQALTAWTKLFKFILHEVKHGYLQSAIKNKKIAVTVAHI